MTIRRFQIPVFLNFLLATAGLAGMAWYKSSASEFWPVLGYFVTLCVVGVVSATSYWIRSRTVLLLAIGINGLSAVLALALLITAFAVSPGSGAAAFPFIAVPILMNAAFLAGCMTSTSDGIQIHVR